MTPVPAPQFREDQTVTLRRACGALLASTGALLVLAVTMMVSLLTVRKVLFITDVQELSKIHNKTTSLLTVMTFIIFPVT